MHRSCKPRRLPAALLVTAALGAAAPSTADAARNLGGVPGNLGETAASANFLVHYTSAAFETNAITPDAAQGVLAAAERSLGDSRDRRDRGLRDGSQYQDRRGRVDQPATRR